MECKTGRRITVQWGVRFSEKNMTARNPYSFIPFGHGPRQCIGLKLGMAQIKSALAAILNKYSIEFCNETPDSPVYNRQSFVLRPVNDIQLIFRKL